MTYRLPRKIGAGHPRSVPIKLSFEP